jgi:citrate lyase subunit beta/citryl-CoA lyase
MTTPARSLLFVPGDRPERVAKALATGADLVIVDLEDAVLPEAKAAARDAVHDVLRDAAPRTLAVRVNALGTPWHEEDVRALAGLPALAALMLPKAERAGDFAGMAEATGGAVPLHALVETVAGVTGLADLCAAPGLRRLSFGTVDFQVDAGIDGDGEELDAMRSMMVLASRAAGLEPPVDGVHTALDDAAGLDAATHRARRFGMGGKLCVHPRQVATVNAAFLPSEADVAWARRVLVALDGAHGAVAVDGKLVDKPIVDRARRILAFAD